MSSGKAHSAVGAISAEPFIPLSTPSLRGNEAAYIMQCIETEWVSSAGEFVDRFEREVAVFTGATYAVACVNGTSALHVALMLAGVTSGTEVIVPTVTFIAPVNAIRYCGAEPVFMDADDFYNIDVEKTADFFGRCTEMRGSQCFNKASGRRISAILPVHVFGNAARIDALKDIADERGIPIIEDATESLGTRYSGVLSGRHTGTIGLLGCLSFNGNKIITTGGGGMILTSDKRLADRARHLTTQAKQDGLRYVHDEVGYNYRLTNLQAALGIAQLEQLPLYLERKKSNRLAYIEALEDIPGLTIAPVPAYADNNCWMYALRIDEARYGFDRDDLMERLARKKIESRPLWYLNHLQRPYLHCERYRIELAPRLLHNTLNVPCSVGLTVEDRERVIQTLRPH